jgi:hypothetical protein
MRKLQLNIGEGHIIPLNVNAQPQRAADDTDDHVNAHHHNNNSPDNYGAVDPGGEPDNVAPPALPQIGAEPRERRYALPPTKRRAVAPIANEEETAIQQAYDTRQGKTKTNRDASGDPASSTRSALTRAAIEAAQHPAQQEKRKAQVATRASGSGGRAAPSETHITQAKGLKWTRLQCLHRPSCPHTPLRMRPQPHRTRPH